MRTEIQIGTPQLVIHEGETVWAAEADGQLDNGSERGLFFRDTRLISSWRLYANGTPWELLNGGAVEHFAIQVFLTNPPITTEAGEVARRTLTLSLGRWMDGGVHEDIDIVNYGNDPVRFNLELLLRSDFADLFEVKPRRFVRRGRIVTDWSDEDQRLRNTYRNEDFVRGVTVTAKADSRAAFANGRVTFDVRLPPGGAWHGCLLTDLHDGDETLRAPTGCTGGKADSVPARSLAEWRQHALKLTSSNEEFYRLYHQGVDDLAALRLLGTASDGVAVMPAAGLPWFAAQFGRDSLTVALQAAPVTLAFARGALSVLGDWQAHDRDDARDAEPGKIMHELRLGELAHFKLVPHTPYYGTADATPLYLVLLHQAWRWTGERALLEEHLHTAEGCLDWIDQWGDRDGDGFQEYQTRAPKGYENMAWKDSGDAVSYPDGTLVRGPKALCELQGYVFAAWTGMAEVFAALGRDDRAAEMRAKAAALFTRFDAAFWDEAFGGYAYALDGEKKKVLTSVSNVGHLLWSGIVPPARAGRVVARLMDAPMFSGWGIRTLAADHPRYNPIAYHNGSVWPHDNGLIAQGFARYGFHAEAATVARAVSGAAAQFEMHQVPELYSGLPRAISPFPVQVPGANVPQAWAAGSAFSFLQALLGMEADAPNGVLRLTPALPAWLPDVTLRDLRLGEKSFDLRFSRHAGETQVEVLRGDAAAVIVTAPARPA
jgi:glycogen debranching enzyme